MFSGYLCNLEDKLHISFPVKKVLYTGTNFDEVKRLCGARVLAPYFCMGFSMLSVDTGDGFASVYEGDVIVLHDDGSLSIEKQSAATQP